MGKPTGALKVRDLEVLSDRDRLLLSVPALDISAGSAVGIKGPSGAGKSTLLFALAGLQPKCRGSATWGDFDLIAARESNRAKFRRSHLGIVFQDFLLFDELGPLQNASIQSLFQPKPARAPLTEAARNRLHQLGVNRDTDDVTSYSGGERQRISVARALAHKPTILLADEPTANLDRQAADALAGDLVRQSREQGLTLLVVSHDEAILNQMDRVITVTDGVVS